MNYKEFLSCAGRDDVWNELPFSYSTSSINIVCLTQIMLRMRKEYSHRVVIGNTIKKYIYAITTNTLKQRKCKLQRACWFVCLGRTHEFVWLSLGTQLRAWVRSRPVTKEHSRSFHKLLTSPTAWQHDKESIASIQYRQHKGINEIQKKKKNGTLILTQNLPLREQTSAPFPL